MKYTRKYIIFSLHKRSEGGREEGWVVKGYCICENESSVRCARPFLDL